MEQYIIIADYGTKKMRVVGDGHYGAITSYSIKKTKEVIQNNKIENAVIVKIVSRTIPVDKLKIQFQDEE